MHDIPLLAEVGRAGEFDAVIVVDAPEEEQVRRLVAERAATEEEARARIRAQATREQRRAIATYVAGQLRDARRPAQAGRGRAAQASLTVGRGSGGQIGVGDLAQPVEGLALQLADPLG